jgi:hypothetical protein
MFTDIKMAMNFDGDEEQKVQVAKLADRLLRIGKDCAAHLEEPFRSTEH